VYAKGERCPPWSEARFDLALDQASDEVFVCLSAATVHRPPPLDILGFPITESNAGSGYLVSRGIAPARIRLESLSLDTIGNAYFSRLLHADPAGWRRLLVITSEFHVARTRAIFEWVYGMDPGPYNLEFAAAPNRGISDEGVQARTAREGRAIESLGHLQQRLLTLRELHQWIFSHHDAYSAQGSMRPRAPLNHETMESY